MAKALTPRVNAPAPPSAARVPAKQFSVVPWIGAGQGEKVILYAPSGMGKTTLAAMAPDPVFIGCDDGGRKTFNPKTGQPVLHVPGIETFGDVRAALQSSVFDPHASVVADTVTMLQHWALPYMFATIKHEKGSTVSSIEGYGYGKGYRHLFDMMHMVLADCDRLVRQGKNIILIAQEAAVAETNTAGENYLKSGPNLHHSDKASVRKDYIEWADHVFRIGWENAAVSDRKITPVSGRCVNVRPDATFEAKSRGTTFADAPVVAFAEPADDSLWQFLFGGK
ncbi:AAA family ATPase [Candidatus Bathyarchaeota archaeon]|nr:AAA family ATPase [Candidatus Bathyarchaeota archaeon]